MGKTESSPDYFKHSKHYLPWHAHITALTVAPEARRLGIGRILTEKLELALTPPTPGLSICLSARATRRRLGSTKTWDIACIAL